MHRKKDVEYVWWGKGRGGEVGEGVVGWAVVWEHPLRGKGKEVWDEELLDRGLGRGFTA